MPNFLRTSFVWQFAAGFALGALGLVALHPAEAPTGAAPSYVVQR